MAHHPHTHGGVADEAALTALLTAAGYSNITNVHHHGHSWHCDATDSTGAAVLLTVDGHGGIHIDTPDVA
jgi:hypothetical protein